MKNLPYDQRVARWIMPALVPTGIGPNQITALTLILALLAAALFASGDDVKADWAAGLFVLARFLDHFDGELARTTGRTSRFGYYFDYVSGGVGYAALFFGIGLGLSGASYGAWALALGALGAVVSIGTMMMSIRLDSSLETQDRDAVGYPKAAGFELEDGIYLLAPITWLGALEPFFLLVILGAVAYWFYILARCCISWMDT